jgi:Sec-independent protein secretion pathway component TatC
MRLTRRLGHDEGAELVQHLDELRSRLIIALAAIAIGFAVPTPSMGACSTG